MSSLKHLQSQNCLSPVIKAQDTPNLPEVCKSGTLNIKKHIGESTFRDASLSYDKLGILCESISEKNISTELSSIDNPSLVGLCVNSVQSCDDGCNHENSFSQTVNACDWRNSEILNMKSSRERKCGPKCMDGSERNEVNPKESILLAEDKSTNICGNILKETRFSSLYTFRRRSKMKKIADVTDIAKKPLVKDGICALLDKSVNSSHYKTSLCEAVTGEDCLVDPLRDPKESEVSLEVKFFCFRNLNEVYETFL